MSRELEALMLDHGADGVSFDTIVAAGRIRRSRTTGPPTRCWPPATSSRSTSARWSPATTRT
ncbi:xaa-Pro dipeptidase domain protein [Mycobacterium xenopi 4042]|uniref:Xaa-Pro dipeptidase domain protein n=1 Tax=Mycobacterium xenopi 4042 TaxID=1299334 RepID=X7ZM86_MYCXE|nr:xaa-Pro dipeptidase domain protein [Mycobacterium xenopi 4042]